MRRNIEKDKDIKHTDDDVMEILRCNKPKKAKNANVLAEGETSSCVSYFFIFGN